MTPEERERMNLLCSALPTRKTPHIFDQLVKEPGELLEARHDRMQLERKKPS